MALSICLTQTLGKDYISQQHFFMDRNYMQSDICGTNLKTRSINY